jgi:hypothetical protein
MVGIAFDMCSVLDISVAIENPASPPPPPPLLGEECPLRNHLFPPCHHYMVSMCSLSQYYFRTICDHLLAQLTRLYVFTDKTITLVED